jgi:hypothetical protein
MKKFLYLFLIFFVGLIGFAFIGDAVISNHLRKSTHWMLVGWNDIYSGKLHPDAVINGSSRAWAQYSPHILDSILNIDSYNLGLDGSPIYRQILKYNTYRRLNAKPKLIIQNIDYSTMSVYSGYKREQFFPYFFDKTFQKESDSLEKYNFREKYLPIYRYIGYPDLIQMGLGFKMAKIYGSDYVLDKGYYGKMLPWDGSKLKEQTEIEYAQDTTALRIFDQYLVKVKAEDIKIVFVYAPLYVEATKKIKNIDGLYLMYDSIAKKHNIPILDYTYDLLSYDTAYFYNANHLNRTGAELFSAKLAHAIDSLNLLK